MRIFGEDANEGASDPRSFAHKHRIIQAAVIVAGICMNLIFGWLTLSAGYMAGVADLGRSRGFGTVQNAQVTIVAVLAGSPAQTAGLMADDTIESLETGSATLDVSGADAGDRADMVRNFIADHGDESVILNVMRGGQEKTFLAKPVSGVVDGRKAIGVQLDDVGTLRLSPPLALAEGGILAYHMTLSTAQGLGSFFWAMVRGRADFSTVAGPIGIASIGSQAVHSGFSAAVVLTALISINLALINVLPIPGLDGGRLLIIVIEGIIRRPVSPRITTAATIAGFALLILLMVVVSYHDIARLIG